VTSWGFIGAGWVARDFAEGLRHIPGARLAAVCSRSTARAFAERFGAARHYADVDALVSDEEVDVVYVATPHSLHAEHCLAALEAGKPVVCEKPFTLTEPEAVRVVSAARERGLFCVEAMPMRFMPATLHARELAEGGAIGDVRMVSARLGHRPPFDPASRYFNPDLGGGALLDVGVYPVSLAAMLLGQPEHVTSEATIGPTGVDEQSVAVLACASGRIGIAQASLQAPLEPGGVISGTEGTIRLMPLWRPEWVEVRRFDQPTPRGRLARARRAVGRGDASPPRRHIPFEGNGFSEVAIEVARCLEAGRMESLRMPLDETVGVMRTLDEIRARWTAV
jgi:predicted dehydrogenase